MKRAAQDQFHFVGADKKEGTLIIIKGKEETFDPTVREHEYTILPLDKCGICGRGAMCTSRSSPALISRYPLSDIEKDLRSTKGHYKSSIISAQCGVITDP